MITIAPKSFSIQAAHHLEIEGITPKCARQHGHTWWVKVWFRGTPNDDGVLVPYEVVAEVAGKYDHQDLNEVMEVNSTGENLLLALVDDYTERLAAYPWRPRLKRVEVLEAPMPGGSDGHLIYWDADETGLNLMAKRIRALIGQTDDLIELTRATQPTGGSVAILEVRRAALSDALDIAIE